MRGNAVGDLRVLLAGQNHGLKTRKFARELRRRPDGERLRDHGATLEEDVLPVGLDHLACRLTRLVHLGSERIQHLKLPENRVKDLINGSFRRNKGVKCRDHSVGIATKQRINKIVERCFADVADDIKDMLFVDLRFMRAVERQLADLPAACTAVPAQIVQQPDTRCRGDALAGFIEDIVDEAVQACLIVGIAWNRGDTAGGFSGLAERGAFLQVSGLNDQVSFRCLAGCQGCETIDEGFFIGCIAHPDELFAAEKADALHLFDEAARSLLKVGCLDLRHGEGIVERNPGAGCGRFGALRNQPPVRTKDYDHARESGA